MYPLAFTPAKPEATFLSPSSRYPPVVNVFCKPVEVTYDDAAFAIVK